mgnify:CR=1 FL=1
MNKQKSMRYDQHDYEALMGSKIPAALVETPRMNFDDEMAASVFFARELDYVKSQSYDVEYPELTALKLFPMSSEIDPGRNRHLLQLRQDRHGEDYQQLRHRPAPR